MKKHSVDDIVDFLASLPEGTKVIITSSGEIPENTENHGLFLIPLQSRDSTGSRSDGEVIRTDEIKNTENFKPGQQYKYSDRQAGNKPLVRQFQQGSRFGSDSLSYRAGLLPGGHNRRKRLSEERASQINSRRMVYSSKSLQNTSSASIIL